MADHREKSDHSVRETLNRLKGDVSEVADCTYGTFNLPASISISIIISISISLSLCIYIYI